MTDTKTLLKLVHAVLALVEQSKLEQLSEEQAKDIHEATEGLLLVDDVLWAQHEKRAAAALADQREEPGDDDRGLEALRDRRHEVLQ
jgi:hypothetical protein